MIARQKLLEAERGAGGDAPKALIRTSLEVIARVPIAADDNERRVNPTDSDARRIRRIAGRLPKHDWSGGRRGELPRAPVGQIACGRGCVRLSVQPRIDPHDHLVAGRPTDRPLHRRLDRKPVTPVTLSHKRGLERFAVDRAAHLHEPPRPEELG